MFNRNTEKTIQNEQNPFLKKIRIMSNHHILMFFRRRYRSIIRNRTIKRIKILLMIFQSSK